MFKCVTTADDFTDGAYLNEVAVCLLVSQLSRCDSVTMTESTNPLPMDPDAAVQIMSLTYVPLVYV